VVASHCSHRPIPLHSSSLNPLHCGAVVASRRTYIPLKVRKGVSIPFIAGQWSLLEWSVRDQLELRPFQSPSLRGSGRFKNQGGSK